MTPSEPVNVSIYLDRFFEVPEGYSTTVINRLGETVRERMGAETRSDALSYSKMTVSAKTLSGLPTSLAVVNDPEATVNYFVQHKYLDFPILVRDPEVTPDGDPVNLWRYVIGLKEWVERESITGSTVKTGHPRVKWVFPRLSVERPYQQAGTYFSAFEDESFYYFSGAVKDCGGNGTIGPLEMVDFAYLNGIDTFFVQGPYPVLKEFEKVTDANSIYTSRFVRYAPFDGLGDSSYKLMFEEGIKTMDNPVAESPAVQFEAQIARGIQANLYRYIGGFGIPDFSDIRNLKVYRSPRGYRVLMRRRMPSVMQPDGSFTRLVQFLVYKGKLTDVVHAMDVHSQRTREAGPFNPDQFPIVGSFKGSPYFNVVPFDYGQGRYVRNLNISQYIPQYSWV